MHRGRRLARPHLLCGAAMTAMITLGGAASAAEAVKFDIPAQPLETALNTFGVQSQHTVMFKPELASGKVSLGVATSSDPEIALAQLLAGTGLTYRREGDLFLIVPPGEGGSSPQDQGAAGDGAEVEALIVTAQKKEEDIQDVPIAISAFTQETLDAQKLEGGFDLLKAIPNVTFSKNNFAGYNFSIRGIGTKAVSATTDPGVAVSFNNTTLMMNRLFEQEYFDVQRVEVLRGPQGTLYGRNATSGVINVLSARPKLGAWQGDLKLEGGNYNAQRARGMINVPIGETLALRVAGSATKRDGYGFNEASADPNAAQEVKPDVDNRDLWSLRTTLGWEPIEQVRVNLLWERFQENDRRVRTSKQLCHRDPAPQTIGSFNWDDAAEGVAPIPLYRGLLSQGCLPGSLYDEGAFGTPNGASLPYVSALYLGPFFGGTFGGLGMGLSPYVFQQFTSGLPEPRCEALLASMLVPSELVHYPIDICRPDPYDGRTQSRDIRSIYSLLEPSYRAKADIFELSIDLELSEGLTLTSQTVLNHDEYYATQDFNRFSTFPIFEDSNQTCGDFFDLFTGVCNNGTYAEGMYANLLPGGVYTDPQLGPSRSLVGQDLVEAESDQFNQEVRLASNFDAPWNFSIGANFTRFETRVDYYVFINALSLVANFFPINGPPAPCYTMGTGCIYTDPNPLSSINGEGHNYFRSANPYTLTSSALFGELYWQATEALKVTLGARMTWDHKVFTPIPSQLLLHDYRDDSGVQPGDGPETCTAVGPGCGLGGTGVDGRGYPANPDIVQQWREPTGRLIVDWKPDLSFTDETMLYASMAHGYKGGGANPPGIAPPAGIINARSSAGVAAPPVFEPEFINAFEVGTKNALLGGGLIVNGSAFYYDYRDYQISKIVDRSAVNENFDAEVWGVELEWIFSPTRNLRFNGTMGHLQTKIGKGERSLDLMDRTQGGHHTSWIDRNGVEHQLEYTDWVLVKPWVTNASNCVAPLVLVEAIQNEWVSTGEPNTAGAYINLCPGGGVVGTDYRGPNTQIPGIGGFYDPDTEAPNGGAGFFQEVGGNELPNAPHWTLSFGAQYRFQLPAGWDATVRVDHYWQDQSFARVYNTEYDRLRSSQNSNFSVWVENRDWGVKAEAYVKNAFDEEPITDAFLNSDDTGLTTNVFTLDPRLVGVSVTKTF